MFRNLAYTKTFAVLAVFHFIIRAIYFASSEPRTLLPEYSSVWSALTYGPLGDVVGSAAIQALTFALMGIPIALVMDGVALFRRRRADQHLRR